MKTKIEELNAKSAKGTQSSPRKLCPSRPWRVLGVLCGFSFLLLVFCFTACPVEPEDEVYFESGGPSHFVMRVRHEPVE
ncbi:MAG: hypothetical protein LBE14_06200 [Treponema sp.]|jgi:hypothetical protein|nr:hypothetical protein [Treponema sp.]